MLRIEKLGAPFEWHSDASEEMLVIAKVLPRVEGVYRFHLWLCNMIARETHSSSQLKGEPVAFAPPNN